MRTFMIASAAVALATAGNADAGQRVAMHGPAGGQMMHGHGMNGGTWHRTAPRWGGRIQGRWWAGTRAPGGWGAYRRPARGWVLPSYWIQPTWYVTDWSGYGLPQPPAGYRWSRYYDDAVLVDDRGSVYDSVGGVGWDRGDAPDADYAYDDGYAAGGPGAGYASPPQGGYPRIPYPARDRDNGLGGAAVGAVVGGVAGNVIAGRGNRLGGTLIGAGVGAAAGYAIDKSDGRGRGAPPPPPPPPRGPGYGADYPAPGQIADGYRTPLPPPPPPPPRRWQGHHGDAGYVGGGTTVVTNSYGGGYQAGGYYAGGYYYPGATVTTISFSSTPVVTTTTTEEIYEDRVVYTKARPRKVHRRVWHTPRCTCR